MKRLYCVLFAAVALFLFNSCNNTVDKNKIVIPQRNDAALLEAATAAAAEAKKEAAEKYTDTSYKDIKSYVLNTRSYKIHLPNCYSVERMAEHNTRYINADIYDLIIDGYEPCKNCMP